MKKLWLLIRVLLKCGKIGKSEKKSSAIGDTNAFMTLLVAVGVVVLMFLGGRYAGEHTQMLGNADTVFTTVMTLGGLFGLFLTLMTAINQLYISSDIDVLITLPFTPVQIVEAKMVSVSLYPSALCFGVLVPSSIGYCTVSSDVGFLFVLMMIIGALLLSLYVVSTVAILVMVLMRVFHFIRSRNVISVVSTLIVFALTMVYMVACMNSDKVDEQAAVGMFNKFSGLASGLGAVFPIVSFVIKAAMGDVLNIFIAMAITAGALLLLAVCAKFIYFSAALGMTDANGTRAPIKDSEMKKYTAAVSPRKALFRREIKDILRTPSMITNGYLLSIAVPIVIIIPVIFEVIKTLKESCAEEGVEFSLSILQQMVEGMNVPTTIFLMVGILFGLLMTSFSVSLSCLGRYPITREGKNFEVLKTMPVSAYTLVSVKRDVAMAFNSISGYVIPSLILLAAAVLKLIPVWIALVSIVANFGWLIAFVNICATVDVERPNLNWETETDVIKSNIPGMILLGCAVALLIGSVTLYGLILSDYPSMVTVYSFALVIVPIVVAVISELRLRRLANKMY